MARGRRKAKTAALSKNFAKINEGSPLPEEEEQNQKKNHQKKNEEDLDDLMTEYGSCAEDELLLKGEEIVDSCEDSDDELLKAEENLRMLQIQEEKVRRKVKLRQIAEETKILENSIKKVKKGKTSPPSSRQSKKTTSATLRGMSDVVQKVDSLMDAKKLSFKEEESTASEEDNETSSSGSDSEEEEKRIRKEKKRNDKRKSGKEKKLTSYVKYPQKWPHSHLKFHFVSKDKKYDDLSLAEFCAGYMSILKNCKSSHKEARIAHLEELMYEATTKSWKCVLNYHAACLLEIERGNLKWGDNFKLQGLQNTTLYGGPNTFNNNTRSRGFSGNEFQSSSSSSPSSSSLQRNSGERVWFCSNFNRGNCTFTRDHYGQVRGENQLLKHICAKCWLTVRRQSAHHEGSETCPLSNVEL